MKKILTILLMTALAFITIFFIMNNTNWIINGSVLLSVFMVLAFWLSLIKKSEDEHD